MAGAVRISGDRERLVARFKDVESLKGHTVLDVGRFSAAPVPSDLARVTFDDHNLDLRACRPGNCTVRLSAAEIARFHREVDWSGADWRNQSAARLAVGSGRLRGGLSRTRPVRASRLRQQARSVERGLGSLGADREYGFLASYSPDFHGYLKDFGASLPPGAEQLLYWTREDFGIRPIVRISHQVLYRTGPATMIAINQVYADHYLDAALTVTLGLDAGRDFYMISVSRARTRSLSGFMRRLVRSTVQSRSREAMRRTLASTKAAIERKTQP